MTNFDEKREGAPKTPHFVSLDALKGDDALKALRQTEKQVADAVDAQQAALYLGDEQKEEFVPDFAAWITAGHERRATLPPNAETRAFSAYYGFALDGEFETLIWGESEDLALLWSLFARDLREGEAS